MVNAILANQEYQNSVTTVQSITVTIQLYNYRAIQQYNYIKMENNKITTCYSWGAIH